MDAWKLIRGAYQHLHGLCNDGGRDSVKVRLLFSCKFAAKIAGAQPAKREPKLTKNTQKITSFSQITQI